MLLQRTPNPHVKTYVYAYMFRRNADNVWHETGQLCKRRTTKKEKKCADLSAIQNINQALWRNADLASKPCVLQHFGFPHFSSITSKYCKGCKFHKKRGFKMLENCGVVPGPLTSFIPQGSTQSLLVYQSRRTSTRELKCFS